MKKNKMLSFSLLLTFALSSCIQNKNIEWSELKLNKTEKYSLDDSLRCFCVSNVYVIDNKIVLYDISPDLPCRTEYFFEKKTECKKLILRFEDKDLKLDSLYLSACPNKDIIYIPGFVKGKYSVKNDSIQIYLEYLNEAINSSESTSHLYYILYDKKSNEIKKTNITFE